MEVEWRDIQGYEGVYQISNNGEVKSLSRFRRSRWETPVLLPERILKQKKNRHGYMTVHLRTGKESWPSVHRLVAIAFVPNPENKSTVNHKDGVKTNNTVQNLEWATESEQMIHAISTGLYSPPDLRPFVQKGEYNRASKLKDCEIPLILKMREQGNTLKSIADKFGVGISQIHRITKGLSRRLNE